ncbi:MAG: hemolysin [Bacteroidetes bacterium GWF2_42_66]|nr:MAG: hemolysin [Bacteroidetes bacterium GWA2_42_15]OFY00073.1 MAG: hemolysin [Bacteroidetes bacterium GWE2_42_39]OFY40216.1 MAG: hemolysin [Bacteroidetes bacterium GWF2_42_66]HBL74050.1 hemolysin [Prolixibacteraceae bacterium]HCR92142.1 hemolysin [Prolixibacteraceae bacterium]
MNWLLIILMMILFSAFFSGMEIAFVSANKLRLELDKKQSSLSSRILALFTRNSGQYIATMMVGNNIALVVYGIAFATLLEPFFFRFLGSDSLVLIFQAIVSALIILVTAEFVPKIVFRINPNQVLKIFSLPLVLFYFLFYPVSRFAVSISKLLISTLFHEKFDEGDEGMVFSRIELDHFVKEQQGSVAELDKDLDNEVKLFRNALDFSKVKLREVMIPRTEMEAMDIESSMDDLVRRFIETGYSRILFYQDNIDNIIGYIHHSIIFSKPKSIYDNLKKVLIVPETMPASKLLHKFIQQRRSIAIVVDEFGGTAGMVTSEDILEEIFGDIEDEHDTVNLIEKKIGDDEYIFSGRLEIDTINEKYNLKFSVNENYETLAGFILFYYESIPKINSVIQVGNIQFKILKATNTRIELVNLKILDNT